MFDISLCNIDIGSLMWIGHTFITDPSSLPPTDHYGSFLPSSYGPLRILPPFLLRAIMDPSSLPPTDHYGSFLPSSYGPLRILPPFLLRTITDPSSLPPTDHYGSFLPSSYGPLRILPLKKPIRKSPCSQQIARSDFVQTFLHKL